MYILQITINIFLILNEKQRFKLIVLLAFFLFSALLQIVGVASIAPFITILSNQDIIQDNQFFNFLYTYLEAESNQQFIIGFAIATLLMILLSNAFSALTLWLLLKFSVHIGGELQERLYEVFLYKEYIFHKSNNYNKVISTISQETPRFVYMVLQPFLLLASQLCVAFLVLLGLLLLDPIIAFASGALIGGSYLVTYLFVKKSLVRHGEILTIRNNGIQAILSESFIGVKDIKLNSLEKNYVSSFEKLNHRGLNSSAYLTLLGDIPKFVIETISFGAILLLAIMLLISQDSTEKVISLLSFYALAGYKLLPTMQQIYKSISSMSANGGVVAELKAEITQAPEYQSHKSGTPMQEIDAISLTNVCYQYPGTTENTLDNINLTFGAGKLHTIAGPSGSGKSTLADVMLGLLPITSGDMSIGNRKLSGQVMADYQASIGYVPQNIFILDDTVLANVAFGVPANAIDIERVNTALRQANAWEFVERLPHGINTQLGQDGKLLSGGQRQRIGIARTLYRNNRVLILDEPTSALDIDSEYELMMLLGKLKNSVLIIVISHRPAAIKLSDSITLLERGKVVCTGSYDDLRTSNSHFCEIMEKGLL